ncbi:hypothetical protein ES705_03452 [subsurface metagenome]|nr:MAG: hypothetical protein CEE42_09050 [Candidatus Lokiarchaeota archaeon Loki_b31]
MSGNIFIAIFIVCVTTFGIAMIVVYITKYKRLPIDVWKPGAAWIRALIYFSFCNIVTAVSGTLEQILNQPIFTTAQISNPFWIAYFSFCVIYVFIAYWILWSRMTLTFNRKYHLGFEIVFGVIWGFSTGGLLLSFYHLWSLTVVPGWANYLLGFASMGLWQYFIQNYFWDIYVSPEHDTPRSIIVKTAVCHIPNVVICLGFLTIWNNYAIYIAIQTFALLASTIFQKFPAPWAKGHFHAPMVKPGIGSYPRGTGYIGEIDKTTGKLVESNPT